MQLTIETITTDSYLMLSLNGDVDTKTAPSLMEAFAALELASLAELRIDMASVGFLSSAGLRALVFAKQKMPASAQLILIGTSTEIADVITKTGLSQAMKLVASHDDV
ncbi:MAG: STAS domain-containing protein [Cyanobacteria bacterium K_DeepCast_35m_m1_288]|nr:STAS domain-containing protein [Cyanobacteria bacterium K_DeepCast_35m_m1_288]